MAVRLGPGHLDAAGREGLCRAGLGRGEAWMGAWLDATESTVSAGLAAFGS